MHSRWPVELLLLIAPLACGESKRKPGATGTTPATPSASAPVPASGWDAQLGPVLLVQGPTPADAQVVVATGASPADTITEAEALAIRYKAVVLLGHNDTLQVGVLQDAHSRGRDECAPWPTWTIEAPAAAGPLTPWSVGFAAANASTVVPVPLDSVRVLSRPDSARLVAEVTRLASTITGGTDARLQGLPFTVTSLWRFRAAPAVEGLAATLVRRVNQEARPLEERTLLIAERDSTRRDAPYELAFRERAQGSEETNEGSDVVAALRLSRALQPILVVAHDYADGASYAFVERDGPAHWRVRWSSARARC